MARFNYAIEVISGIDSGKIYELVDDYISIGHGECHPSGVCRISLDDSSLDNEHIVLYWDKNEQSYIMSNRSKMNPAKVNDTILPRVVLTAGMTITIGSTSIKVLTDNPRPGFIYKDYSKNSRPFLGDRNNIKEGGTPAWLAIGKIE